VGDKELLQKEEGEVELLLPMGGDFRQSEASRYAFFAFANSQFRRD
jgi:hypothetical protein